MSDRASVVLAALGDGERMTTDQIVEATGLERSAVAQELAAFKNAGRAISGRGGWSLPDPGVQRVKRHQAADMPAATSQQKRRGGRPKGSARPPSGPKPAPVTHDAHLPKEAAYVFGITELGQLTITDRNDAAKTMRMSQVDTARLALALKRWATLIAVGEKEAA